MSGIAGIIRFDAGPVEPGLIESMTGAMSYRGPDGINRFVRGSISLGQCMLHTTPESLEETQPLSNEDESVILVMDGRIDNWGELRRELLSKGAKLRTRADAELVLRAYEIWDENCPLHIDGDFALVIWDSRQRKVFCARDRIGNKSLNYFWNGKVFIFASELVAILSLKNVPQIYNEGLLAEFLAGEWYSTTETLWKDVMRLGAAHQMTVHCDGLQLSRYWWPRIDEKLAYKRDEEYVEHYRELLSDRVRRLSRSHRPISSEVSGGLDSSAVFAVALGLYRSGNLLAPKVDGYTLAFADDGDADELFFARSAANFLEVELHEVAPSRWPLSWYERRARRERNFPGFPNGAMLYSIRQRLASNGNRVLLDGEGGDEWLGGSRLYYAEELSSFRISTLWNCLQEDISSMGISRTTNSLLRYGVLPLLPRRLEFGLKKAARMLRGKVDRGYYWLSPHMRKLIEDRREQSELDSGEKAAWRHTLYRPLEDALLSTVIEEAERLAAGIGIEERHPMRTAPFVEFAFSIPERLRLRGERSKYIHAKAMHGLLPNTILKRRDKADFSIVFSEHLNRLEATLTDALPKMHSDWLDRNGMVELVKEYHRKGDTGHPMWRLWSIYATCSFATER